MNKENEQIKNLENYIKSARNAAPVFSVTADDILRKASEGSQPSPYQFNILYINRLRYKNERVYSDRLLFAFTTDLRFR